jgi:hypothetical protein
MGRMAISWCNSSQGVLQKAPVMTTTAAFWTACKVLMCFYWFWNQMGELYVSTGMHMALYASLQLPWSRPLTEFPSNCRALRVLLVLAVTTEMCLSQDSLWSK